MERTLSTLAQVIFCLSLSYGQASEIVDITEQTIKVSAKSEEEIFSGFAEGDIIVFNFNETDGKEVKEVEIIEMPTNSKFKGFEVASIKDKRIKVARTAVYKFRLFNDAAFKGRVCSVKIQRIPKGQETLNFNTSVRWIEKYDTTYEVKKEIVTIGYNTITKQKSRRALVKTDTNVVSVTDRIERVHSTTNANGNVSLVTFQLPQNSYSPNSFLPYKSTEVVSWAYSIAVGKSGKAWYKDAEQKAAAKNATELAVGAGIISSGYGALALLAIEGFSAFSNPPKGDNVQFRIYKGQASTIHYGNSVAVSQRETSDNQGYFTIRLENGNIMDGINVDIKVIAVTVTKTWQDEAYTVEEQEPIKEEKIKRIPKRITSQKVPVIAQD